MFLLTFELFEKRESENGPYTFKMFASELRNVPTELVVNGADHRSDNKQQEIEEILIRMPNYSNINHYTALKESQESNLHPQGNGGTFECSFAVVSLIAI